MKTIRNVGREVQVKSVAEPAVGAGQVKIRIRRTAISTGTELFKMRTAEPGQEGGLGYMAAGVVEEVRDEASGLKAGDRVFAGCSHAEYGVKDAIAVHPLPEGVDFRTGVVSYWAVPAIRGIHRMQPQVYDDLAVVGQGAIGLMGLQILRHVARKLIAVDVNPFRLAASKALGADLCVNPLEQDAAEAVGEAVPEGPHRVLEASGTREGLRTAFEIVRPRGVVVALRIDANLGGLNLEQYMYRKDLTLISSGQPGMAPSEAHVYSRAPRLSGGARDVYPDAWYFHREIQASLEMIQSGYIQTDPLISHEIVPEEAPEIFRKLADRDRPAEILGVVVRWE